MDEKTADKFIGEGNQEQAGRGRNVEILLKVIRHGERTKEGELTDHGREITAQRAAESGISAEDFDAVKAIGSTAGPKGPDGMQRALETADIYAEQIAGDKVLNTRGSEVLSYETLKLSPPFDWKKEYDSHLPDNFEQLSNEEKVKAAKTAQAATFSVLFNLHTPEAEDMKKELAGSFAYLVDRYTKMAHRLDSGSRVLMPAGTHGGSMEFLLQCALVWTDEQGVQHTGLDSLEPIGGEFSPSDSYNVSLKTDAEGNLERVKVTFDSPERPKGEMWLDLARLEEPLAFYRELHPEVGAYPEFTNKN